MIGAAFGLGFIIGPALGGFWRDGGSGSFMLQQVFVY
jgi:hypothetical protein